MSKSFPGEQALELSLPPGQFSSTSITSTNHHKLHCSGLTHFRTEGAADLVEEGIRLTPELIGSPGWLVAIYGLLGREKEARAALDFYNEGKTSKRRIQNIMYLFPFKDRSVADRFAEGMIKAGMPGRPSGYFPAYKENQLMAETLYLPARSPALRDEGRINPKFSLDYYRKTLYYRNRADVDGTIDALRKAGLK